MLTNETLTATYESLKAAVITAFSTGEMAIQAKAAFETGKAALLLDGRLDGKNQEQRDAQARELLAVLYRNAEAAEKMAREAKCGLETARLDVGVVRAQLRLLELTEAVAS